MACCEKMRCKACKEISKLAYLATHLHETYTIKPADKQIVKQRLHFLHEILNLNKNETCLTDSRSRIREAMQPYL